MARARRVLGLGRRRRGPLRWIIVQPECDRATAATIFWLSEPSYYLAKDDGRSDPIKDMELEIIARWRAGQYKTARFDFGGDYMDEHRDAWVEKYDIPASLADPIEGTEPFPMIHSDDIPEVAVAWHNATGKRPSDRFLEQNGLRWDGEKIVGDVPSVGPVTMTMQRPGKLTAPQLQDICEGLNAIAADRACGSEIRMPLQREAGFAEDEAANASASARIRALRSQSESVVVDAALAEPKRRTWIDRLLGR